MDGNRIGGAILGGVLLASFSGVSVACVQQDKEVKSDVDKASEDRRVDVTERMLRKEAIVTASAAAVWQAWTTVEGVNSFFGHDADIELAVGGKYEIYFDLEAPQGLRGSEGCKVLAYLPERMLAFTWNTPPTIARLRAAGAQTQVVLQFEELSAGRVKVAVSQHGFGEGDDWDKYYDYFDRAWDLVLGRFQERFGTADPTASAGSPGKASRKQHFVYFVRPSREGFFDRPTEAEQNAFAEHVAYVVALRREGTVVVAGRCFEPAYYPESNEAAALKMPTPGIVVFEAAGPEAARRIMEADPAVKAGLLQARLHSFSGAFSQE